jgi:hypothetical protein
MSRHHEEVELCRFNPSSSSHSQEVRYFELRFYVPRGVPTRLSNISQTLEPTPFEDSKERLWTPENTEAQSLHPQTRSSFRLQHQSHSPEGYQELAQVQPRAEPNPPPPTQRLQHTLGL